LYHAPRLYYLQYLLPYNHSPNSSKGLPSMTLPIQTPSGFLPAPESPYPPTESIPLCYGRWGPPVAWGRVDEKWANPIKLLRWTLALSNSAKPPMTYVRRGKRWPIQKLLTLLASPDGIDLLTAALTNRELLQPLLDRLNLLPHISVLGAEPHDYRAHLLKPTYTQRPPKPEAPKPKKNSLVKGPPEGNLPQFEEEGVLPSFLKLSSP